MALRSRGVSLVWLVTPVVAVSSGAKALGMLLHEANIIATKERTEMKTIEFFIAGKIVVESAGHSITNRRHSHKAPRVSEGERTNQSNPKREHYPSVLKLT